MTANQIAAALKSRNVAAADKASVFGMMLGRAKTLVVESTKAGADGAASGMARMVNGYKLQGMLDRGEITMEEVLALPK